MAKDIREREEAAEAHSAPVPMGAVGPVNAELVEFVRSLSQSFEEVVLPSKGLFYGGKMSGGAVHVRPMTMKEEKLLATPRLVRSGKALDMIFESCVREKFNPDDLLSVDRTYLLIWLRGISYDQEYDVQIKCSGCNNTFPETVNLSELAVEFAKEDMQEPFRAVFPRCGQPFTYRLSRGKDEAQIARHRERKAKSYGEEGIDDTLVLRDTLLVDSIGDFREKAHLTTILENLTMEDATYLHRVLQNPGFGVNTRILFVCPFCSNEFETELPMDANFFFPRRTKTRS